MKRLRTALVALGAAWFFHHAAVAQSTADYTVTFRSTWSAMTHPQGFPPNPHFSGLIGATHDATVTFWATGSLASPGIQNMAETGSKVPLRDEVEAAIQQGGAGVVLDGGGIGRSPGLVALAFTLDEAYPLVTLVSMIAPSPDWFVGVSGLNLFEGGAWVDTLTVELFPYDAGTDSGASYTAPNQATDPHVAVAPIETTPFLVNGAVPSLGTFTFTLRSVATSVEDEPPGVPGTHVLSVAYPHPFALETAFTLSVRRSQHVRVDLFDLTGRRVETLFEGTLAAGPPHRFLIGGRGLPGGAYLYRVVGEDFVDSRAVVLVR